MKSILNADIINTIKRLALTRRVYLSKDANLIFVCGASLDANNGKNARKRFLDYSKANLPDYDIFIAEKFFDLFKGDMDLLTVEDKLGNYSDCIIIFLESPSSIAELGAFSNNEKLVKQLLVINDKEHETATSFIIKGPLVKISKQSEFGETIYCNMQRSLEAIGEIKKKLIKMKRKYNKGINLKTFEEYSANSEKSKMLFLLDLITLLQPVKQIELESILEELIGDGTYYIEFDIKMLMAVGYITEIDSYYIKKKSITKMYYIFEKDRSVIKIRSLVLSAYRKNDKCRIEKLIEYYKGSSK